MNAYRRFTTSEQSWGKLFFEFGTEFLGLYLTLAGWETECTTAGGGDEGSSKFGCQGHGFRGVGWCEGGTTCWAGRIPVWGRSMRELHAIDFTCNLVGIGRVYNA